MTKAELMDILDRYGIEDGDNFDINEVMQWVADERQRQIEKIEERQHSTGFYAQQDLIALYRYER